MKVGISDVQSGSFHCGLQDDEAAMNFVASAANLRAFIFSIPLKSKFDIKCKLMAEYVVDNLPS